MDQEFWQQRWQQQQIGFHNSLVNPQLLRHWSALALPPGSRVLVPLCGKSLDMLWLLEQGYQVVGVELSELAINAFISENQLTVNQRQQGDFQISESAGLQLFCGDFFKLTMADVGEINAVYDRAALVALPTNMRQDYVKHLRHLLAANTQILLVSFAYPQAEMVGPPFSVSQEEINALYQIGCELNLLAEDDILSKEPQWQARGITQLHELVYRIQINAK